MTDEPKNEPTHKTVVPPRAKPEKRLHPVLSNEEVLAARAKAKDKIAAEQKAYFLKAVEEAELKRLREEEFQTVGGPDNELVHVTIDLPEFSDRLLINFRPFFHGHTYTVPRHQARDMIWMMQAAWQHQLKEIDGKKLRDTYYRNASLNLGMRETKLNGATGAVENAPSRPV